MDDIDALLQRSRTAKDADPQLFEALTAALSTCETTLSPSTLEDLLSALKQGWRSPHASVAISALATVPALCPLLATVPESAGPSQLRQALSTMLAQGGLFDRLGDKDRVREVAGRALLGTGRACVTASQQANELESPLAVLDKAVKEQGLGSKAARVREMTLHYLVQLRAEHPQLPLRPYVGNLIAALEDSDQHVRDAAREATIAIFSNPAVSAAARADLKTQLAKHSVRKATVESVLARVLGRQDSLSDHTSSSSRAPTPDLSKGRPSMSRPSAREPVGRTVSMASTSAVTTASTNEVSAVYVASARDLESEFAKMHPAFEGKETEHNWQARDRHVARIRGMLQGEVQHEYLEPFMTGLRSVLDGLVRTLASLRTTLATAACNLMEELGIALGHSLDPLLDPILSALLKLAAQTKKIVVSASQAAATSVLSHCSYQLKMLTLLEAAVNEKTAQARQAGTDLLRTFVKVHAASSRQAIESGSGLELLAKAVARALIDATPAVREQARTTFWAARAVFPARFDRVMAGLDGTARTQLEKANGATSTATSPAKARPSVRAMISAKRTSSASSMPPPSVPARTSAPPAPISRSRPSSVYARPSSASSQADEPRQRVSSTSNRAVSSSLPRSSPLRSSLSSQPPVAATPPPAPALPVEVLQESQRAVQVASGVPLPAEDDDLLNYEAPFRPSRRSLPNGSARTPQSARQYKVGKAETPSSTSGRSGREDPIASTLDTGIVGDEIMVEDAIRDQAEQAEQTAARLLELAEEEAPRRAAETVAPVERAKPRRFTSEVFQDSPAPNKERPSSMLPKSGHSWWLQHAQMVTSSVMLPLDANELKSEAQRIATALEDDSIAVVDLRKLARICAQHPLHEKADSAANGYASNEAMWTEGRLFERVFEGITVQLRRPMEGKDMIDASYVLLKELVQHQAILLSGRELPLFDLLLSLRMDASKQVSAAIDAIAGLFCDAIEPLYGIRCLRSSLTSLLDRDDVDATAIAKSHALGSRCLGQLFARLPAEVLEEEVPLTSPILLNAFNATQADLRQAAAMALVSALIVLGDETQLFTLLPALQPAQRALLTYYASRS